MREESDVPRVPLPRLSYPKLVKLTGDVHSALKLLPNPVTCESIVRHADTIHDAVDAGTKAAIVDSLLPYCGEIDDEKRMLIARQLAGRRDELRTGPIMQFYRPTHDQWVPLEVTSVTHAKWRDDKPGADLRMLGLAFQPAGHLLSKLFPSAFFRFLAYKIGFSRRIQYDDDVRHIVGLRFWLQLKKATDDSPQLEFDQWDMSPWMMRHNKQIIALRTRFEYERDDTPECPAGHTDYCWGCKEPLKTCPASMIR